MAELKYRDEGGEVVSLELEGREMIIGRLPECDIVLAKPYVSRRHARVFRESGNWYVEDLGSAGGTFLNRLPLTKRGTLVDGDEIGIGDLRVTFNTPENIGKKTIQRAPPPIAGNARKTMLGQSPPGAVPGAQDEAYAATNPAYTLPVGAAEATATDPRLPKREVRVRHTAGTGAWSKLVHKSRGVDPTKVLTPERTGSLVDANIAGAALRFANEIVAGPDKAAIYRRALILALRAVSGDRAAIAVRRESDGAYITTASVVTSSGKFADATFEIDPEMVAEVTGTKEGIVAHEGNEIITDARTVRPTDVRTIVVSPFLEKDRIAGWVYADARGVRTDLGATALDLLAFIGATAANAATTR